MLRLLATRLPLVLGLAALVGCQSFSLPVPNVWPWRETDRTSFRTPIIRIDAISQIAAQADGIDSAEQRELTDQLARQIQIEPDALVRKAIVEGLVDFRTPLAQQVIEAGLGDRSPAVRIACCQILGRRGEELSVRPLANALRDDEEIDVRLAAAEALGQIDSSESVQALVIALDDRDPALQYVGVQALQSVTGQDYGGDVAAWRQYAAGENPLPAKPPTLAERLRNATPF